VHRIRLVSAAVAIALLVPAQTAAAAAAPAPDGMASVAASPPIAAPGRVGAGGLNGYAEVTFSPVSDPAGRVAGYRVTVGPSSTTVPAEGPYQATFSGLPAGRLAVTVTALSSDGSPTRPATTTVNAGDGSTVPTGTATAGVGSVAVAFRAVRAAAGSLPVTGYRVTVGSTSVTTTRTAVKVTGLTAGVAVPVTVTVLHGARDGKVASLGTVTPLAPSPPAPPTALTANGSRNRIRVNWRPSPTSGVTGYQITIAGRTVSVGSTQRSANVAVPPGTHTVSVVAVGPGGTSVAATTSATAG
jgi:hypothetical protein